jgi:hypothetical protein
MRQALVQLKHPIAWPTLWMKQLITYIHRPRETVSTGFGRLHNHFQFQSPADIHGDTLKKKLDQTRSLETSQPFLSSSTNELLYPSCSAEGRFSPAFSVLGQPPIHSPGILESPAWITGTPIHSAISSRSIPFYHGDRSPNDSSYIGRSSRTLTSGNNSDDATSTNPSYDFTGAVSMEMEEGQSLKRLHMDDTYAPGGQKRRAASPNDEYMPSMPLDTSRGRELSPRRSPQGRFTSLPRVATMPSVHTSQGGHQFNLRHRLNCSMYVTVQCMALARSHGSLVDLLSTRCAIELN